MRLLLHAAAAVLIVMLLAALLLPPTCGRLLGPRLLEQLDLAVRQYEKAYGVYPPGDGRGCRDLLRALSAGRGGCGFLRDKAAQDVELPDVHYRRNPPGTSPPFAIWILDTEGRRQLLVK